MGVLSTIALIIFFCFVLVDKTDGHNMTFSSSSATVGQPVTLYCAYIGSSTPFTINFYLDPDTLGLKIRVPNCNILSSVGYDISLYDKSCGGMEVNLTIKSVTAADIGKTWYCDATFLSGPVVAKASIQIIGQGTKASPPEVDSLTTAQKVGIGVGCGVGLIIVCISVFFIWRHLKLRGKNSADTHVMEPNERKTLDKKKKPTE